MSFEEEELKKLKVADLKTMLSERNLPVSGKKEELIQRLMESDIGEVDAVKSPNSESSYVPLATTNDPLAARQARFGVFPPPSTITTSDNNMSMKEVKSKVTTTQEGHLHVGKATALDLSPDDIARIRARQERFGTTAPVLQALEALDKRQQRAGRFQDSPTS